MRKIKISVHPLFILLGILMMLMGNGYQFIAYSITIVLHEFAHAEVARKHGIWSGDINLMPYGARLQGAFNGVKTSTEIKIALAGPIFNLLIALIFTALFWIFPPVYFFAEPFVFANFTIAILNFAPVFPMDGGRIFLAALAARMPRGKAVAVSTKVSEMCGLIFSVLFAISMYFEVNATLGTLAIFMFSSALTSLKDNEYKQILDKTYRREQLAGGLTVKEIAILKTATLAEINRLISGSYCYRLTVLDDDFKILRTLSESELSDAFARHNSYETIGEYLATLGI